MEQGSQAWEQVAEWQRGAFQGTNGEVLIDEV